MNFKLRLVAMLILVMMLFTSCSIDSIMQYIPGFGGEPEETTATTPTTTPSTTPTTSSTTTSTTNTPITLPSTSGGGSSTPDKWKRADHITTSKELTARYTLTKEEVDAALALIDSIVEIALQEDADMDLLEAKFDEFDTAFYHIAQQMTISMIVYYVDMNNETSSQRYLDTQDMFYSLQDKYNEACRTMYLESPHKDELFEGWTDDEIQSLLDYDPAVLEIRKEIDALEVEYNELGADEFNDRAAEIYAQIVTKNNQLAKMYGYDNYYDYATENVYGRDYTKESLAQFREYVIEYIAPAFGGAYNQYASVTSLPTDLKTKANSFMNSKFDGLDKNYLIDYLNSLEGTMGDGMRHMFENKNCVISGKPNSHPTAFQTYLYEDETPFCLFGSSGQSSTTVVHEIGHYYAALTNNDLSNYDLMETHSQGNEFLFLNYCSNKMDSSVFSVVEAYQLVNAYYIIIMATIIDEFEQTVYSLDSVEGYTSEDFDAIMSEVCKKYGGDLYVSNVYADPFNYWRQVCVTNPVYYISYAVSSVAALEIAALVAEDKDAAFTAYTTLVEGVTEEDGFLKALEKAGLTTPFDEETYTNLAPILTKY